MRTTWLLAASFAALLLTGLVPAIQIRLIGFLVQPLEERFPPWVLGPAEHIDGIIALGGDFKRFEAAVELARQRPGVKLLMSAKGEVQRVRALALKRGLPSGQVLLEEQSTTTYENAKVAATVLAPRPGQRWLLVTSALHMPRAVGAFSKAGFAVLPWPVLHPDDVAQRHSLEVAWHEWIGLITYWLLGRTNAIFPGPGRIMTPIVARPYHCAVARRTEDCLSGR